MRLGAEFDALIARFCPDPAQPVTLGVSGGSDSTALLHLIHHWSAGRQRKVHVLTVDHQLRQAAKAEAAQVEALSHQLGFTHQTLLWDQPVPGQAAARQARHLLLAQAARTAGATILLLGHTLDDVVETAIMRRRRRNRGHRSVGPTLVAPSPVWPDGRGIAVVRPLIWQRRLDLRTELVRAGLDWVEDPSNASPEYERPRIRATLARFPALSEQVISRTRHLMAMRADFEARLGRQLIDRDRVSVEPDGLIRLKGDDLCIEGLADLCRIAGGSANTPDSDRLKAHLDGLRRTGDRFTLSGAWVQKTLDGLLIGRDPAPRSRRRVGAIWDGRYELLGPPEGAETATPAFLVRQTAPPAGHWREILSDRIAHLALCYQTPFVNPVIR